MTIIVNGSNTPTAGAVGYGDGTNLAFTSAGTTGQFLSSNGSSAPSWVGAPASAMTLISTQTVSSVSSVSWTGLSGYSYYLLEFAGAATGSSTPILLNIGYGSTTYPSSGYNYCSMDGTLSSSTYSYLNTNSSSIALGAANSYYTGGYAVYFSAGHCFIKFYNGQANFDCTSMSQIGNASLNGISSNVQGYINLTSLTAIKVSPYSGTLSGSFSLYGISS
jgi:hypothetical protein